VNVRSLITEEAVMQSATSILPAGTLVLVTRTSVGKAAILTHSTAISQDITGITPSALVDARYLLHFLRANSARLATHARGATIKGVPRSVVAELRLPVPSITDQRRIAAILDQVEAVRAKRRQVLAHLDALSQSIFHDMFGDPAEWPSRWCMGRIEDMAESVQYGTSAKAGETGQWPILRMGNLTDDGRIDLSDLKYIDLDASDIERYTVRRGDLLFNRTNSWEKVGKAAVVRTDAPLALAGYLVRVRVHQGHSSEFISAYLRSGHGKSTRRGLAKVAVNQANISAGELKKIPIALPPKGLQHEFARRLDVLDVFRSRIQEVLGAQHILFQALQSRAFRGEL
jgi:type I restriction enzyme, S subunit